MTDLPDWVKPGVKFRVFYQPDNPNNRTMHVRAIVDGQVVLRQWWPSKRRWNYTVEHPSFFYYSGDFIHPAGRS